MDDYRRIRELLSRLDDLLLQESQAPELPIIRVAIDAVESEIARLGRRLERRAREGTLGRPSVAQ